MNVKKLKTSAAVFCFAICSLFAVMMCGCSGSENVSGYISFPGLGIDWFGINRVAFTFPIGGGFSVMWYGVIITSGMALAYICGLSRAKIEGIKADDMSDLAFAVILSGIVGARLYYVIFYDGGSYFNGSILEVLKNIVNIRSGGLAIYGGVIGGAAAALIFSKFKKIKSLVLFDMLVPCVLIGQIIGRWGNFFNMEAYGCETEFFMRMGLKSVDGLSVKYVHPTFLYESIWNLVGLIIILLCYKKKKYDGQILFMYMTWYGFGRGIIEGLRTDSLMIGSIRVSQLVAFISFAAGLTLLIVFGTVILQENYKKAEEKINSVESEINGVPDIAEASNRSKENPQENLSQIGEDVGNTNDTSEMKDEDSEENLKK